MPIVAACPYCPTRVKVPDHLLGTSFGCPKCGNCFTVTPAESLPARQPAAPPPAAPRPTAPAQPPPPAADAPWWVTSDPVAVPAPAPPEPPPPPAPTVPSPIVPAYTPPVDFPELSAPSSSTSPGWINVWGALAFALTALALLLAAFTLPRWLTISFTALGLLLGVVGVLASLERLKMKDAVWLVLGGGGSGVLLFVTLVRPGWINDRWGMDFAVPEPDRNKLTMVSRDNPSEDKELPSGDRVDAQTHAIRQGDVLVRVESASVERVLDKEPPILLIALSIANAGQLHNVTYHGQAGGEQRAVVRDSRGKELQRRDLGDKAKKTGQIGTVTLLPTHEVKDVLAVEAPWSGTENVEVDLPSAAWGCEGVCKFTIPGAFIVRKNRGK